MRNLTRILLGSLAAGVIFGAGYKLGKHYNEPVGVTSWDTEPDTSISVHTRSLLNDKIFERIDGRYYLIGTEAYENKLAGKLEK